MKNNIKKVLVAAGILGLASVGSVSAYLTDFDKVSNQFTVGKVDVELKEENWKIMETGLKKKSRSFFYLKRKITGRSSAHKESKMRRYMYMRMIRC